MKLFKVNFKLGKNLKSVNKIAVSPEDAFQKIQIQYARAAKPPLFLNADVLIEFGEMSLLERK